MDYWEAVLQEVLHKNDDEYEFLFTNVHEEDRPPVKGPQKRKPYTLTEQSRTTYFLGEGYEGVYFTKREAECLFHLLQRKTISETARDISLSPRTVEYYVKNMKVKLAVPSKAKLLEFIIATTKGVRINNHDI